MYEFSLLLSIVVGWILGTLLSLSLLMVLDKIKDKRRLKDYINSTKEDIDFLRSLERKGVPNSHITVGERIGIYGYDGELIYDSVRGCVNKATYI